MTVNITDAGSQLPQLIAQVEQGREVVIAKEGRPVARLVPVVPSTAQRVPGTARGQVWVAENFDAPLPGDVR